jgi:hypothetical protein
MPEEDVADRLVSALSHLDAVVDEATRRSAAGGRRGDPGGLLAGLARDHRLGPVTMATAQRSLAGPATPPQDPDLDEVGESG